MLKAGAAFFLALLLSHSHSLYAQAPSEQNLEDVAAHIRSVEEQFHRIEAENGQILDQEEKILAEIDRVRVWIHRVPGTGSQQQS